ncbi:MAG: hypothetical protein ACK5CF_01325 [Opitutaceae bacterium]
MIRWTSLRFVSVALAVSSILSALPLSEPTPVHVKPESSAAAFTVLKAGSDVTLASPQPASLPFGWAAVELAGPHEVYVQNKDITKSLDVRPGAELRQAPKADAPLLTLANAGETLDITGLHGRWTQLKLARPLVGYIKVSSAALPLASTPRAALTESASTPAAPLAPPPVRAAAQGATVGEVSTAVSLTDSGGDSVPRIFQGRFVSTRSAFRPRRPYDWALADESGSRFAYLDVSRLLQTEPIENYAGRTVAVLGAARALPGTKDFVIVVESLQLR